MKHATATLILLLVANGWANPCSLIRLDGATVGKVSDHFAQRMGEQVFHSPKTSNKEGILFAGLGPQPPAWNAHLPQLLDELGAKWEDQTGFHA